MVTSKVRGLGISFCLHCSASGGLAPLLRGAEQANGTEPLFMVLLPPVRIWRGQAKGAFMAAGAFILELRVCVVRCVRVECVYTATDDWLLLCCFLFSPKFVQLFLRHPLASAVSPLCLSLARPVSSRASAVVRQMCPSASFTRRVYKISCNKLFFFQIQLKVYFYLYGAHDRVGLPR